MIRYEPHPWIVPREVMPSKVICEHNQDVWSIFGCIGLDPILGILVNPKDFKDLECQKESTVRKTHCSELTNIPYLKLTLVL